jgi:hypothetical protein
MVNAVVTPAGDDQAGTPDDQAGTPSDPPIDFGFDPGDDEQAGTPGTPPTTTPVDDGYRGFPGPDDEPIPSGVPVEVIDFGDDEAELIEGDPNALTPPVRPSADRPVPPEGPQLYNVGPPPDLTEEQERQWWQDYYEWMTEWMDELRQHDPNEGEDPEVVTDPDSAPGD